MERRDEMEILRSHIYFAPPVDVSRIIEDLGIEYVERPLGPNNSGRIDRVGDRFRITVNSEESKQRRRFTAAHEIGHYLLHRDLLEHGHADRLFGPSANLNPAAPFTRNDEIQANQFAADLLMPRSKIEGLFREGIELDELAGRFGVSKPAMEIRLKSLGLGSG